MIKILVTGSYSKVGKTRFIESLIKEFKLFYKIGVIKLNYGIEYKQTKIIDDIIIINEEGKDTKRFVDAGAFKVILIKHNRENIKKSILKCIRTFFKKIELLIIEGNSGYLQDYYSLIIFIRGLDQIAKHGIKKTEKQSDFVIDNNFANINDIKFQIMELFNEKK